MLKQRLHDVPKSRCSIHVASQQRRRNLTNSREVDEALIVWCEQGSAKPILNVYMSSNVCNYKLQYTL